VTPNLKPNPELEPGLAARPSLNLVALRPELSRTPRACAWPPAGTSCVAGDSSFHPGASHASGDRISGPGGVGCPRPVRAAPGRVECPRPHSTGWGLLADPPPV